MRTTRIRFNLGPSKLTVANCRRPTDHLAHCLRKAQEACPSVPITDRSGDYGDFEAAQWQALSPAQRRAAVEAYVTAHAAHVRRGLNGYNVPCPIAWPVVPSMVFEPEFEEEIA